MLHYLKWMMRICVFVLINGALAVRVLDWPNRWWGKSSRANSHEASPPYGFNWKLRRRKTWQKCGKDSCLLSSDGQYVQNIIIVLTMLSWYWHVTVKIFYFHSCPIHLRSTQTVSKGEKNIVKTVPADRTSPFLPSTDKATTVLSYSGLSLSGHYWEPLILLQWHEDSIYIYTSYAYNLRYLSI